MFDFFKVLKCRKLQLWQLSCICVFLLSILVPLLTTAAAYAYHVKLRKAYVKLVFTRKAAAKGTLLSPRLSSFPYLCQSLDHGVCRMTGIWGFPRKIDILLF